MRIPKPTSRRLRAPWILALLAVYTLTVAAWLATVDWSAKGDLAWGERSGQDIVYASHDPAPHPRCGAGSC